MAGYVVGDGNQVRGNPPPEDASVGHPLKTSARRYTEGGGLAPALRVQLHDGLGYTSWKA